MIHDLEHARAALAAARVLGVPVRLASAPGAAAYLGAGFFRAMAAAARREFPEVDCVFVLDCGADAGLALGACREGVDVVQVSVPQDVRIRIAEIASHQGVGVEAAGGGALDLRDCPDPRESCRKWLENARE